MGRPFTFRIQRHIISCAWTTEVLTFKKSFENHTSIRIFAYTVLDLLTSRDYLIFSACLCFAKVLARCACAVAIAAEVQKEIPIKDGDIKEMFLDKVADDDISVTSDIDAAILEKSASFSPLHDIGAIKEALAKHEDKKPVSQTPNEDLTKKMKDIEDGTFKLLIEQAQYDIDAMQVFMGRKKDAVEFLKNRKKQWALKQHAANKQACIEFNEMTMTTIITPNTKFNEFWTKFVDVKKAFGKKHKLQPENVITVVLLNWVAPCTLLQTMQQVQAEVTGAVLADSKKNIGLCLTPIYTYKEGSLFQVEPAEIATSGG